MHLGKKNNKGITLVELIVTVAILAIIVLPLLRAFVVSAKTNAKAKEKLRTTELAQNIMEGLEASDLEHVAYQFNYPGTDNCDFTFVSGQNLLSVQEMVMDADGNLGAVTKADGIVIPDYIANPEVFLASMNITSSIVRNSGETTGTFVGQTGGVYYFAMKNLTAGGDGTDASSKQYDALITVSANRDTADNGEVHNDNELVTISSIDAEHDALCVPAETTDAIMAEIWNRYPDVQQSDISRKITVSIEEVSATVDSYTRVTVSYQYTWTKDGVNYVFPSGAADGTFSDVVFENAGETDRELSNVYLFFYPWYTSTQGNRTDVIDIENPSDQDVTVYLVKQESSVTNLETLENGYRVTVNVEEPFNSVSDTAANTCVRTNLNTNLYTDLATTGDQAIWSLRGVTAGAEGLITRNTLTAKEAENRLFDVTVEIFPAGSYDSNFKDSEAIVSLTGGMLN
jgi:prepilin-type N-terminal cleavage/methylation domain-containing protein